MSPPPSSPSPLKKLGTNSTVTQLRSALASMELDTTGKKETLLRRLSSAVRRSASVEPDAGHGVGKGKRREQPNRVFLCFDVEATCAEGRDFDWPNEIIEFPVVLLRWTSPAQSSDGPSSSTPSSSSSSSSSANDNTIPTLEIASVFHSYVKPVWKKELTLFCTSLTGITQEMVDKAPTFPEMLLNLQSWLTEEGLLDSTGDLIPGCVWCTDGPWDLRDFIPKQLYITPLLPPLHTAKYPPYLLHPYINIKESVAHVLSAEWYRSRFAHLSPSPPSSPSSSTGETEKPKKWNTSSPALLPQPPGGEKREFQQISTAGKTPAWEKKGAKSPGFYRNIEGQLEELGLGGFVGRSHSGIDDAKNLARIMIELAKRDVLMEANAKLPPASNAKKFNWMRDDGGRDD